MFTVVVMLQVSVATLIDVVVTWFSLRLNTLSLQAIGTHARLTRGDVLKGSEAMMDRDM